VITGGYMEAATKYISWYSNDRIGRFDSLQEAKDAIKNHPKYKKSLFTKKGDANSRNPNSEEYFRIYDNNGAGWYIQ
jgi:hypothetical protein